MLSIVVHLSRKSIRFGVDDTTAWLAWRFLEIALLQEADQKPARALERLHRFSHG